MDENINRLHENNLTQFQVKVYPDGGHAIWESQTHEVCTEYLHDLVQFVKESELAG